MSEDGTEDHLINYLNEMNGGAKKKKGKAGAKKISMTPKTYTAKWVSPTTGEQCVKASEYAAQSNPWVMFIREKAAAEGKTYSQVMKESKGKRFASEYHIFKNELPFLEIDTLPTKPKVKSATTAKTKKATKKVKKVPKLTKPQETAYARYLSNVNFVQQQQDLPPIPPGPTSYENFLNDQNFIQQQQGLPPIPMPPVVVVEEEIPLLFLPGPQAVPQEVLEEVVLRPVQRQRPPRVRRQPQPEGLAPLDVLAENAIITEQQEELGNMVRNLRAQARARKQADEDEEIADIFGEGRRRRQPRGLYLR